MSIWSTAHRALIDPAALQENRQRAAAEYAQGLQRRRARLDQRLPLLDMVRDQGTYDLARDIASRIDPELVQRLDPTFRPELVDGLRQSGTQAAHALRADEQVFADVLTASEAGPSDPDAWRRAARGSLQLARDAHDWRRR